MKKFIFIVAILFSAQAQAQDESINVMSAEEIENRIQGGYQAPVEEFTPEPVPEFLPPSGDSVADLVARLAYVEEAMRRQNGQISQLQFELKNLATQLETAKKELAAKSEQYLTRVDDVNDKYVIKVDGAEEEAEQDPAATEEADFNAGVAQISEQNLPAAQKKFTEFISTYPESDKIADAYFWLGEISMDEAKYKESALNYLRSYKADKQGKRAEEALLKSSTALGKLGKKAEACKNLATLKNMEGLQDLIKEQANSEAIKLGCKG